MEHFDEIVTDRRLNLDLVESHLGNLSGDGYLLDHYQAVASSGSSGRRGVFVFGWQAWTVRWRAPPDGRIKTTPQALKPPELSMIGKPYAYQRSWTTVPLCRVQILAFPLHSMSAWSSSGQLSVGSDERASLQCSMGPAGDS